MTSDTSAPGGDPRPRRGRAAGAAAALGTVAALGIAGVVGWQLAGPPWSGAAVVPPSCPVEPGVSGGAPGVADQLVPMPLPQPRGPASVRVCGYVQRADGQVLDRDVVLDPVRTAALAAVIDEHPGPAEPGARRPAQCPAAGPVVVLAFRYTQGPPVFVAVRSGECGLVATRARVETGRQDVVRRVSEILASG